MEGVTVDQEASELRGAGVRTHSRLVDGATPHRMHQHFLYIGHAIVMF